MQDLSGIERVHVVGIGGAGMSALARVLRGWGMTVQGSDLREGRLVADLRVEGIRVKIGHAPRNVHGVDLVLVSSAVPDENVELQEARRLGISVVRRPDFFPLLTAGYQVIAVAGAHGKTTVTGMIATILEEAGLDPTYVIGGVVENLGTNARAGRGRLLVIEADEYRSTFLALRPYIAVITNVEFDHPDCFPGPRFVRLAFGEFVDRIRDDGALVACNDDPVAHAVAASYHANGGELILYGLKPGDGLAWRAVEVEPNEEGGVDFVALRGAERAGAVRLRVPGAHNALNALAALAVAERLGIAFDEAREGLRAFTGTARRFEVLGVEGGVVVVDDYAHHPTQIRVVLEAARGRFPGGRIFAVWQPHTFSRVVALRDEFCAAFEGADRVVVLPVYAAREVDDGSVDHVELASDIEHPEVTAVSSLLEGAQLLEEEVAPGDVVILMGAGDEYVVGEQLLAALVGRGG
jgi:UDP-N-acetylmuramate--alanine ligase